MISRREFIGGIAATVVAQGARSVAQDFSPAKADTMYFGGDSDGLYWSTDGGKDWQRRSTSRVSAMSPRTKR